MKKITAVVVTYNRASLLNHCLETLNQQLYPVFRVILVDNCSTDQTQQLAEEWMKKKKGWIRYERLPENVGGAGGFCHGFACAIEEQPDWIFIMDDDAAPEESYLKEIMIAADAHPQISCLIGTEYVGTTSRRAYGGRRRLVDRNTLKEVQIPEEEYKKDVFYIDSLAFVGPVIRYDLLQKTGLPDKDFFIYYDDTDYSFRLRQNSRIMCVSKARINHRTDFARDVIEEGRAEWRQFYMYRNGLMLKKRYIQNPKYRKKELLRAYYHKIKDLIQMRKKNEINKAECARLMYLITRATIDVMRSKLGKVDYVKHK